MINEEKKVIGAVEVMTAAFHAKNMVGVLGSYEKEASIIFEPGNCVSDPEVAKQMFEGLFQLNPNFVYPKGHEVYFSKDIALHISPWMMTGTTPDGQNIKQQGLSVAILRKQENGEWLLVLDYPHGEFLMNASPEEVS